jgi:hypothetical protein
MLGKNNFVDDLASLDPEVPLVPHETMPASSLTILQVYRHLLSLREFDDATLASMELTFEVRCTCASSCRRLMSLMDGMRLRVTQVSNNEVGEREVVELMPGGSLVSDCAECCSAIS